MSKRVYRKSRMDQLCCYHPRGGPCYIVTTASLSAINVVFGGSVCILYKEGVLESKLSMVLLCICFALSFIIPPMCMFDGRCKVAGMVFRVLAPLVALCYVILYLVCINQERGNSGQVCPLFVNIFSWADG